MVAVILLVALCLFPANARAATYYVSTTGSNSNSGTSEDAPFLTVKKAVDTMVAGDTTYVRGGTYTETATIRFGVTGTQTSPIKLLAYPGESPIITWPGQTSTYRILIENNGGDQVGIGWITISGFELKDGFEGIKFASLHNSVISNNWIHGNINQGILGIGGHHVVLDRNIVNHNGPHDTNPTSTLAHGVYLHGSAMMISNNLIYDNLGYGIQQNGSSSSIFNSSIHPGPEFALAQRWIVVNNTIAYNKNRAGIVVWGSGCDDSRYENNIYYENAVTLSSGNAQGIDCTSCTGSTGLIIKNNHLYASGSGGQVGIHASLGGTISGNVTNVSAPAFVNGGANALPSSPDFRLTASAPVNIALANEFPKNSTSVVGAYETIGTCSAAITANKITLTCPMSTALPIQNLSSTGVSVGCAGSSCPSSHTVSSVSRPSGALAQVEVVISGISGNACVSTNQTWTISYNQSLGTWSGNDNIGPYPGAHQKLFSFTSLPVSNRCNGTGPASYPSGYHIYYKFDEGTGINANDESANGLDCTLVNGATWGTGKTGSGMVIAAGSSQHCTIPWGINVDPSTQSLTIFVPVNIAAGLENAVHYVAGPDHGNSQRLYICARDGTWRVSFQSTTCSSTSSSNLTVTSGWNVLTLRMDSGSDIFTLYKDTTAGTGGATGSYTSYQFATNWTLGKVSGLSATGATFDDFLIYLSLKDPADLVAAFNATNSSTVGTLSQEAIQFQGIILDTSLNPIVVGAAVQTIEVPAPGGAVLLFQVHCENIADCALTSFKLVYSKNGSSTWNAITDSYVNGTKMWASGVESHMNNGLRSTRLAGSCPMTTGNTHLTSTVAQAVDLPQDGCTVLGYVVLVGPNEAGNYFDYKLRTDSDQDLSGGYDQIARLKVVNPMGGGIGF